VVTDHKELRDSLKSMAGPVDSETAWAQIEQRAGRRRPLVDLRDRMTSWLMGTAWSSPSCDGTAPAAQVDEKPSDSGRPFRPKTPASRPRSRLRMAGYASMAVILVAGVTLGGFELVKHLGKSDPAVLITDDTAGMSPGATGQTGQTLPSDAQGGYWELLPLSTDGGSVNSLVMDPDDPAKLYATTDDGLFRSTDGAVTWKPVSKREGASMMVSDPSAPSTVYRIGGDMALYKSVDGGAAWRRMSAEFTGLPGQDETDWYRENAFTKILIDPSTSPSTLYGIRPWGYPEYSRLCKSTDGGSTWQDLTQNLGGSPVAAPGSFLGSVAWLEIDPAGHVLYAGCSAQSSILRSPDGGATWEDITAKIPGDRLTLDPRDPSRLYSYQDADGMEIVAARVLVSTDRAETWYELAGTERDWATTVDLADRYVGPGTPAAVVEAAAAFLGDFAGTVADASTGFEASIAGKVIIDPSDPSVLYAPTSRGVYKSVDGGATWHPSSKGMTDASVYATAVDPTMPSTIYAATSAGVMKSVDGGATWATMPGITGGQMFGSNEGMGGGYDLLVAPSSPSVLYFWTTDGLWRSDDGGSTWAKREATTFGQGSGLLLVASNRADVVYANGWGGPDGMEIDGLYRSTDGGLTWGKVDGLPEGELGVPDLPPRGASALVEAPGDPSTLYASAQTFNPDGSQGPSRLYKSVDSGQTWAPLGEQTWTGPVKALAVNPGTPPTILAIAGGGSGNDSFWRSTDGGHTWTQVETDWSGAGGNWGPLLLSGPLNSDLVYAVSDVRGLYRSINGGASWMSVGDWSPAEVDRWGSAVVDPAGAVVYVATPTGLYKWVPGALK
jgi:photosystem II stability/assembly factor-like uncharacterized protein